MKIFPFLMLLAFPLSMIAETEEVELDEEKPTNPPLKRSFTPQPKLFLIDRAEIQIEMVNPAAHGSISIRDGQNTVVFQADYFCTTYTIPVLENTQTYTVSLYIGDCHYSGTIFP